MGRKGFGDERTMNIGVLISVVFYEGFFSFPSQVTRLSNSHATLLPHLFPL